jgi:glycosyltransferase involved in cell wall biosynthesis
MAVTDLVQPVASETDGAGPDDRDPLVSVVIPTRGRPSLVRRAVESALGQTWAALEVVVVLDGPDEATRRALEGVNDDRVRVVELAVRLGGAAARNAGVQAAFGEWVAFLDDDDLWMPHKLEAQLGRAEDSAYRFPILCSQVVARAPAAEYVWPHRQPAPGEALCDYLFVRRGLFQGEGLIQSSMILAPRALLLATPFDPSLPCHQDWDWVLHAGAIDGAGVEFVSEPLAVWHIEEDRARVSGGTDWQASLRWIDGLRHAVTPRAYASFVLTSVSARAARAGAWWAGPQLLWRAVRFGQPRLVSLVVFVGIWLVPQPLRWRLRSVLKAREVES